MKFRFGSWVTSLFAQKNWREYLVSVSLIVLSLMLTAQLERWREAQKDSRKLKEYFLAIETDIKADLHLDSLNVYDAYRDLARLQRILVLLHEDKKTKSDSILIYFREVMGRGVFRAFPPTTFELISQSGDAALIKDIGLRNKMATVFAFRQNIIRPDFAQYDASLRDCAKELGQYVDLSWLLLNDIQKSWVNKDGFYSKPHNEILLLYRDTQLKIFHLEIFIKDLIDLQKTLKAVSN